MANSVQVHVKCHLVGFSTIYKVIPILESMNQLNHFFVYLCDNLGENRVNGAKPCATTTFKDI